MKYSIILPVLLSLSLATTSFSANPEERNWINQGEKGFRRIWKREQASHAGTREKLVVAQSTIATLQRKYESPLVISMQKAKEINAQNEKEKLKRELDEAYESIAKMSENLEKAQDHIVDLEEQLRQALVAKGELENRLLQQMQADEVSDERTVVMTPTSGSDDENSDYCAPTQPYTEEISSTIKSTVSANGNTTTSYTLSIQRSPKKSQASSSRLFQAAPSPKSQSAKSQTKHKSVKRKSTNKKSSLLPGQQTLTSCFSNQIKKQEEATIKRERKEAVIDLTSSEEEKPAKIQRTMHAASPGQNRSAIKRPLF